MPTVAGNANSREEPSMKFEFRPIFKGFKFKPERYRRMMRTVSGILAWVLLLVFIAAFLLRRLHAIAR